MKEEYIGSIKVTKEFAINRLREEFKKGDTIYTQLYHVSKSGMTRHIGIRQLAVDGSKKIRPLNWSYLASFVLDWRLNKNGNGLIVGGCGMDMGFHTVYTLSSILFNDGYALKHEWL